MGLKILGRVGTDIFFFKYNFIHFAFQNAVNYTFSRKQEKNSWFHQ